MSSQDEEFVGHVVAVVCADQRICSQMLGGPDGRTQVVRALLRVARKLAVSCPELGDDGLRALSAEVACMAEPGVTRNLDLEVRGQLAAQSSASKVNPAQG